MSLSPLPAESGDNHMSTGNRAHSDDAVRRGLAESARFLADSELEFSESVRRCSAALHGLAEDPLVARTIFHLSALEGSPLRARFAAQLLMNHGQDWMASLLVARGLHSGAKVWEKRNLRELLERKPRQKQGAAVRMIGTVALDGTEIRVPGSTPGSAATAVGIDDVETWIGALADRLRSGGVGIHRDVVQVDVAGGDTSVGTAAALLSLVQVLPVTVALVLEDVADAAALVAAIPLDVRERMTPVIAVRTGTSGMHLVTAGGGSLYEIGSLSDLQLHDEGDLAAVSLATGLLSVYASKPLTTHRAAVMTAFRAECSSAFPLWSDGGWIERAMRYRGTAGETASLRFAVIGHLISTGYYGEAHALLAQTPEPARDRIHTLRSLRALFGLGRFADVIALSKGKSLQGSDLSIVRESHAAQELLDQLGAADDVPHERLDIVEGRVLSILHASVPEQSGGYAVRAHSVLQELTKHGFDVVPYTRPGFPETSNVLSPGQVDVAESEGIAYRRIGTQAVRKSGEYVYMLESVEHYKAAIRSERPEAVHLRSTHVSALPGLIAAKHFGIPAVYEVSGMWELVFEAANDARMEGRRARTVILEDAVLEAAESVCTITAAMGRIIEGRATLRSPLRLVPNAVDVGSFAERPKDEDLLSEFGWDPATPVIGYIGSFVNYEGLDVLVRALSELRDRGVEHRALLVGDGAVGPGIRALAKKLELSAETHRFTGRVPHEEVAKLYSLVDVCAYPRRLTPATEAVSPLKPFEALASGKTVIVSDVPALVEIAGDGERARVVPEGNHLALADSLQAAIEHPHDAAEMRARAQRWVREERSWDAVGTLFADQIRDMVGARAQLMESESSAGGDR